MPTIIYVEKGMNILL